MLAITTRKGPGDEYLSGMLPPDLLGRRGAPELWIGRVWRLQIQSALLNVLARGFRQVGRER